MSEVGEDVSDVMEKGEEATELRFPHRARRKVVRALFEESHFLQPSAPTHERCSVMRNPTDTFKHSTDLDVRNFTAGHRFIITMCLCGGGDAAPR